MNRRMLIVGAAAALLLVSGVVAWRAWKKQRHFATRIAEHTLADGVGSAVAFAPVEDWPAWRGPRGDGISRETGLATTWPAGGPRRLWSADVGLGYSSPVAAGGVVYLFSLNNRREALTAFDARTGHILWSDEGGTGWTGDYAATRSTPAIDGDAIYTYGGGGDLICRDRATGKPRWSSNVLKLTGARNLVYGSASSPLVAGDLIYVQGGIGGPVAAAIDKTSGQLAWQSEAQGVAGYAHPILANVAGAEQLIVFAGDAVVGTDPRKGKTLWRKPWETSYQVNSSTPVYREPNLFVTSSYGMGCIMLRLSPDRAAKVWSNKSVKSKFQQTILDGDSLYANNAGQLVCLSWPDGAVKWKADKSDVPLGENGSIVRAGDKLLALSDEGQLSLLRATPAGVESLARAQVVEGPEVWATPLLYGGRLYVKGTVEGGQRLVCLQME